MSTTELDVRPEEQALRGFEIAERMFTPERRASISKFLNVGEDDPVLLPYLVTCATYGLSPIMGEIWLIPQKVTVRDGDSEKKEDRYRPAVGRDGFLSIARRDKRYRGIMGAVICEHDTFEVEYSGNLESDPKVLHRFASKPTVFEPGASPDRYRGRIIGAWAKALIDGQPPQFYVASIREHGKMEQAFRWGQAKGERVWIWLDEDGKRTEEDTGVPAMVPAGAWDYASAMILKAAQSYVLRIGFGITGLAPADEIVLDADEQRKTERGEGPSSFAVADYDWSDFPAPEELRERLIAAVDAVNELAPMSWSPAKIDMVLRGRSETELAERIVEIEAEAEVYRVNAATRAQAAEEEIADAEVVEDKPLTDEERVELEQKRHHAADLEASLDELEAGTEEHATVCEQLNAVESQIRPLAARESIESAE